MYYIKYEKKYVKTKINNECPWTPHNTSQVCSIVPDRDPGPGPVLAGNRCFSRSRYRSRPSGSRKPGNRPGTPIPFFPVFAISSGNENDRKHRNFRKIAKLTMFRSSEVAKTSSRSWFYRNYDVYDVPVYSRFAGRSSIPEFLRKRDRDETGTRRKRDGIAKSRSRPGPGFLKPIPSGPGGNGIPGRALNIS